MWKPMGMANAIVIFAIVRLSLGVFCCSVAAISVALGIYGPEQWPPMFGSLKDAYTVRRFWAYVSKQSLQLHSINILLTRAQIHMAPNDAQNC